MIICPEVVNTVVDVDGVAMSALVAELDQPQAVIVAPPRRCHQRAVFRLPGPPRAFPAAHRRGGGVHRGGP